QRLLTPLTLYHSKQRLLTPLTSEFELFVSTWRYFRINNIVLEGNGIKPHKFIYSSLGSFLKNRSELSGAQEPFTKKEEALADFKEGDLIIATSDKNVKNMTSFVALEILLLQKPNLQNTGR
ncbi:hypothetical protein HY249_00040, partial [Candidatus Azambacteria bacterium]|nr:hypothetical protein [Candidatus Azambacteria bacterium]